MISFNGSIATGNTSLCQSQQLKPFPDASLQQQPHILQPRCPWQGGTRGPIISSLTRKFGITMMMIKEYKKTSAHSVIVPHPPEQYPASVQAAAPTTSRFSSLPPSGEPSAPLSQGKSLSVSARWQELTHHKLINGVLILSPKHSTTPAAGMKANPIPAKARTMPSPHSIPSPVCSGPTPSKTSKSTSHFLPFDANTETEFP